MLSHEEEEALAAMEARLRSESPDLHAMFEQGPHPAAGLALPDAAEPDEARPSIARRLLRVVVALAGATAATAAVTVGLGPELGGLVGALAFPIVGLYGWSQLTGHGRHGR